jgi:MATE family multidrug resistance protein
VPRKSIKAQDQRGELLVLSRQLIRLAIPLILSSSFLTLQLVIDRALLTRASSVAVAAAMPASVLYWTLFLLPQNISNYATTFVAQYTGAGRPERVGPVIWQSLYFSLAAGLFIIMVFPLAGPALFALGGHPADVQQQEAAYFGSLCFAAFPALLVASVNSFFAGRGDSWTVFWIDASGLAVNAPFAYALIFGHWGFPEMGIVGAGWATTIGSTTSAILALSLFFRTRYEETYRTRSGWRFDGELFRRLMRFGLPNGLQWFFDNLAFTAFLFVIGALGTAELAATSITISLNMVALLPMLGMAQAVCVLVGQRLGQDRPDLAERTTWLGFAMAWVFISGVAVVYVTAPEAFLFLFHGEDQAAGRVAQIVPVLLRFVAVYSVVDSLSIVFAFALRGAGDTRFVTKVSISLAWPIMVFPTIAAWYFGWGLYWAWGFLSAYVIAMGVIFLMRFRYGRWKSMRVIEVVPKEPENNVGEAAAEPAAVPSIAG